MKKFICIFMSVFTISQHSHSAELSNHNLNEVAETVEYGEDFEIAALPAVAILVSVGLSVVRKSIIRTLTSPAASRVAVNYVKGNLKKVGKKCFSIRGEGGSRVLLAADKVTVLWGGASHDIYEKKIGELCR